MNLRARIRDFLHEMKIARLYNAHVSATQRNLPRVERMRTWELFRQAVMQRSPGAIKRLEKARGLV